MLNKSPSPVSNNSRARSSPLIPPFNRAPGREMSTLDLIDQGDGRHQAAVGLLVRSAAGLVRSVGLGCAEVLLALVPKDAVPLDQQAVGQDLSERAGRLGREGLPEGLLVGLDRLGFVRGLGDKGLGLLQQAVGEVCAIGL